MVQMIAYAGRMPDRGTLDERYYMQSILKHGYMTGILSDGGSCFSQGSADRSSVAEVRRDDKRDQQLHISGDCRGADVVDNFCRRSEAQGIRMSGTCGGGGERPQDRRTVSGRARFCTLQSQQGSARAPAYHRRTFRNAKCLLQLNGGRRPKCFLQTLRPGGWCS